MRNILELNGLDNKKVAIDSNCIYAVSEMDKENINGNIIPKHTAVLTEHVVFKVTDSYDSIIEAINDINRNEDLGL